MVKTSPYWKYFIQVDKLQAQCKICDKAVTYSGNTSNLKSHLSVSHASVLVSIQDAKVATSVAPKKRKLSADIDESKNFKNQNETSAISVDPGKPSSSHQQSTTSGSVLIHASSSSASNISPAPNFPQENIKQSFAKISDFKEGGTKHKKLTDKILYMICKDCEPFNVVEKEGFRELLSYIAPNYKIPSRTTISNCLDIKYNKIFGEYRKILKEVENVTLTTDIWTDALNTKSYIGVTVHYLENGNLTSGSLGVRELTTRHTGENIRDVLTDICNEWDIDPKKISAIVTDNGANVVRAVDLFIGKNLHLACCAHTINLIAVKSTASVSGLTELVNKVKSIVTFFKQSVRASDDLRQKTDLKLKQEVATRWNSTFFMLVRFLELRSYVSEILINYPNAPIMLSAKEISILKEIVEVLRPLEVATRELCAQKYVTASKVIPLIHGIENEIKKLTPKSEIGDILVSNMLSEIRCYFGEVESAHMFAIATLLDPRFKMIEFDNFERGSRALKHVKDILISKINAQNKKENPNPGQKDEETQHLTFTETEKFSLWSRHRLLKEKAKQNKSHQLPHGNVPALPDELSLYLKAPLMELEDNPITYWKDMSINIFPNLAPIALKYLSVVATSVPCERLFSKAGHIMNEKRNRLKGSKLHKQLFLNQANKSLWLKKGRKRYQRGKKRLKFNRAETGLPERMDFKQNTMLLR